jgi:hypothetical protein
MDSVRGFVNNNRSLVMNGIFVAVFVIVVYFVYKFFTDSADDAYLSGDPINANSNSTPTDLVFQVADPDQYPDFRVREGGDFAFSTWIYVNSYSGVNGTKGKPIFVIKDDGVTSNYLLVGALYPTTNQMLIRAYTGASTPTPDMTSIANFNTNMGNASNFPSDNTVCDIQNVDIQRWVNITVAVSGRIMDIYMDGKLSRSCILPNFIKASTSGTQRILMAQNSGFAGSFSRIRFFNYSPTPDQIYANYQAGPYKGKGFFEYLGEQIGIKFTYVGAGGAQQTVGGRSATA